MSLENKLTKKDIFKILESLNAEPLLESTGNISSKTVCHNGTDPNVPKKRKLVYYDNSGLFVCYSGCEEERFRIVKLVEKAKDVDRQEAIAYIEHITGVYDDYIDDKDGFDEEYEEHIEDLDYIKTYVKKKEDLTPKSYDEKLLNSFHKLYHISFIKDNISKETMKKFGLLFDIQKNRIIIPHYFDDKLVAIRCRNLNKELVDDGLKYTPIKMYIEIQSDDPNCKKLVKKPIVSKTGGYLYGLPMAAEAIKRNKMVILFEAEKSPMQMYTYFGDESIALATMGSNLSEEHVKILLELGVEEVVIAFDKEFIEYGDAEDKLYRRKLRKRVIEKLLPYFKVSVIYDRWNYICYKDSPSDKGKETFLKLFNKRFYVKG